MKNLFFLIFGLLIMSGSVFLFFERLQVQKNEIRTIKISGTSIKVEIADTLEAREKGLSDREVLPSGTGMLFIFDQADQYGFWMKDMNFAIDIVWIDEGLRIIDIEKGVAPETFPQIFYPDQPVKYVLELPVGFGEKYHIDIGQIILLDA